MEIIVVLLHLSMLTCFPTSLFLSPNLDLKTLGLYFQYIQGNLQL